MADSRERLAIVGMAFRFPGGAHDEASFWRVLSEGVDAVGELGSDRWDSDTFYHSTRSEAGRSVTKAAGLLEKIDEFDAAFFGISPREAARLDPQQRLLLELAWEALENGGQPPDQLAGADCAVFVGISGTDFGMRGVHDLSGVDAHAMTGSTMSIAANRLSYIFDLRGPSMAVDTACSSSLVALHQACNSIRSGECSSAMVGGVHMLLHPLGFVGFSKASMLSARGRCRAFDASGDGYVRSEGGTVLFIKPLDHALRDGDPVHAVILATGANADGHKKGLTIPSAPAQAELIRTTCRRAGLDPVDLTYIEAHGTGTMVGDPIEAHALGEAIGSRRPADKPLPIGSVKTNVGHLEAAAGMAGLVKAVLSLKRGIIPASLHLETPNPHIDFEKLNLRVVTKNTPIPPSDTPARMGVNSFGFGGANAHVILEQKRNTPVHESLPQTLPPIRLSARHPAALQAMAGRFAEHLGGCDPFHFYSAAHTAHYRRQVHQHGLLAHGDTPEEIVKRLLLFQAEGLSEGVLTEDRLAEEAPLALIYSGNGSQWAGMGRLLLESEPLFLDSVRRVDELLSSYTNFSVETELRADLADSRMDLTEVAQPALFAIQVGITDLLRHGGLQIDSAIGHSVGEIAAAWATGKLDLGQAVRVIYERSAAQAETLGAGRMAAVGLSPDEAAEEISRTGLTGELELAGVNSPDAVTLSGSLEALESLRARLEARGIFFRLLDLEYAFHSRHMDGQQERILERLSGLQPQSGGRRFVSTVTGGELQGPELGAGYWWDNIRKPVLLDQAVDHLAREGVLIFMEIGPHPILQRYIGASLRKRDLPGRAIPTLFKNDDGQGRIHDALARVHLLGGPSSLDRFFPVSAPPVPLPAYPWQRESHWYSTTQESDDTLYRKRVHPLLGWRVKEGDATWENHLDLRLESWLTDHSVGGTTVFPATGFVEMALAASAEWFAGSGHEVEDLEILSPLILDPGRAKTVRFDLDPSDGTFRIRSRERLSEDALRLHAVGRLRGDPARVVMEGTPPLEKAELLETERTEPLLTSEAHYQLARRLELNYGPVFQGVRGIWSKGTALLARLELPEGLSDSQKGFVIHPASLDAAFQTLLGHFRQRIEAGEGVTFLPVRVGAVRLFKPGVAPAWCTCEKVRQSRRSIVTNLVLFDKVGKPVGRLDGCRFRAASLGKTRAPGPSTWAWNVDLKPREPADRPSPIPDSRRFADLFRERLKESEGRSRRRAHYEEVLPLMDAMVGAFAHEALRGWAGIERGPLPPLPDGFSSHPISHWLLNLLDEDGFLELSAAGAHLREPEEDQPLARDIWMTLLGDHPEYLPDLTLAGRVGLNLIRVFRGELSPRELAETVAAGGAWEQYHSTSPSTQPLRTALGEVIGGILRRWPPNRSMRILEIGPNTLFRTLEPSLQPGRFQYVFASEDQAKLDRARMDLGERLGVTLCGLDPDTLMPSDPESGRRRYDLVLVHHQLSRVSSPRLALRNLKRLLALDGVLSLVERRPDRWSVMALGLDRAWWHDGTGAMPRQLSPAQWTGLVEETGLVDPQEVIEPHGAVSSSGAFAILARNPDLPEVVSLPGTSPATWLFLTDSEGWAQALASELALRLEASGHRVFRGEEGTRFGRIGEDQYTYSSTDSDGITALLNAVIQDSGGCQHVVHLQGLESEVVHEDPLKLPAARCLTTLDLLRSITREELPAPPRLWLLTRGAATFADPKNVHAEAPDQAALWGLGRVLMNERPDLECTLIDLQTNEPPSDLAARVEEEFSLPDGEDEIILAENGQRLVSRLRAMSVVPGAVLHPASARLDFALPGQLRNLEWRPRPDTGPGPDEVEIETRATGLNFRDVMYAMGLLSDEAVENGFGGAGLGMEVAGRISRVGVSVDGFSPGDEVVAFTPAGFAGKVLTHAGAVALKPKDWTFEAAATVPTVFFTVWYALHHLARIEPEERVLIHGAAGGVGIAALQIARHLGAEIFATAGTDEKRDFVRLMGADHVMDSRSLVFADQILEITGGDGVDVVLNSLAGEAVRRSFQALRPFGRFLELGKRDFYENTRIGLRPFKDNISYFGIDADQLMAERPELATRIFREVMELFSQGVFRPLPYRRFPATRIVDAFRYMQQARQIGKVVITFDDQALPTTASPSALKPPTLEAQGTYLVTGGTSGFGLRTAVWMAEQGAGHLLLVSRRGEEAPEAAEARRQIEALGATAHIRACDVEDLNALREVLAECGEEIPELRGVVHAAMVLEDGLLRNSDDEKFLRAMAPKIRGAWNLHALTRELPLDLFVLYSSASTYVGNTAQGNYVAANLYLEALAAKRRGLGLPATCVAWGIIDDVGYLARNQEIRDGLLARVGGAGLDSALALDTLGQILTAEASQLAVWNVDWNAIGRVLPSAESPRFTEPRRHASQHGSDSLDGGDLKALIAGKSEEEAKEIVTDLVAEEIAQILRLPRERIPLEGSLYALGMDSLMGVELVLGMEKRLGVTLPTLAIAEEPNVRRIADRLIRLVTDSDQEEGFERDAGEETRVRGLVTGMAATHDVAVAEDQVDAAVGELLKKRSTS